MHNNLSNNNKLQGQIMTSINNVVYKHIKTPGNAKYLKLLSTDGFAFSEFCVRI